MSGIRTDNPPQNIVTSLFPPKLNVLKAYRIVISPRHIYAAAPAAHAFKRFEQHISFLSFQILNACVEKTRLQGCYIGSRVKNITKLRF
jgi:hypothetical protein